MFYCIVSILLPTAPCQSPTIHSANFVNKNPNTITIANDMNHCLKSNFNVPKKKTT